MCIRDRYFNVKGAILWGILITWGLGIIAQFTGWYAVNPEAGVYSLLPSGSFLPLSLIHIYSVPSASGS